MSGDPARVAAPRVRILLIDDEAALATAMARLLDNHGFSLTAFQDPALALLHLARKSDAFDVILLDVSMPGMNGLEVLEQLRLLDNAPPVVMWTADASAVTATTAMRAGAFSYATKPVLRFDEFATLLNSAASYCTLKRRTATLERRVALSDRTALPIGESASMQALQSRIEKLAGSDISILVLGESGTGKELVARAIHAHSARAQQPFIAINCGGIAESMIDSELFGHSRGAFTGAVAARPGVFVEADGGTLFLDEIGEMSLAVQARLLRVLQEGEVRVVGGDGVRSVDVRVVAATHIELQEAVEERRFRADLYYRLNVATVQVPPLRARMSDVPILAAHFLRKHGGERPPHLTPSALEALMSYAWPGNVRELENALLHAVALRSGDVIDHGALPRLVMGARPSRSMAAARISEPDILEDAAELSLADAKRRAGDDFERRYLARVLDRSHGNIAEAARLAGLDRSNFRRVLSRLEIDVEKFRHE